MPRVKRGTIAHKKREKLLKLTKGFKWGRKSKERLAKEALLHALSRKFEGRKNKKREYRSLWITKMNAGLRENGTTYRAFIAALKSHGVVLDRKILADLAEHHPEVFARIVSETKVLEKTGRKSASPAEPSAKTA